MPLSAWWLIVTVLAAPLAVLPASWGPSLAETKNLAFLLLGAGTVLVFVRNLWLRAFGAWVLVAYLVAGAHVWALSAVLGVLAWLVFYQAGRELPEAGWAKLRLAVLAGALFQVAWVLLQLAHRDPIFEAIVPQSGPAPLFVEPVGWLGNPMDLALFLGISLPLLVVVRPVWLGGVSAALTAVIILGVLRTTVGVMAVGVTTVWLLWSWSSSWWVRGGIVLLVLLVGGLYFLRWDPHVGLRFVIWKQAAHVAGLRPFAGWGPNAVDHRVLLLVPAQEVRWNFIFNEWLQAWLELGLLGPGLALGYVVSMGRRLQARLAPAAELAPVFLIVLLASFFSIPFRIGPVALLAALALGQMERRLA